MPVLRAALGIFSDEGGAFLGGYGMSSDNRLKTLAGLSSLWDGATVTRWRAGDGVAAFHGRRVALHLMLQPVFATTLLSDAVVSGQGFLARVLICEPESAIGTRTRLGYHTDSDLALACFEETVGGLLRRTLPLRDGMRNELDPPLLALSDEAREALSAFHLETEKAQIPGGRFDGVRPFASKAAEHAARLAAVLVNGAEKVGHLGAARSSQGGSER